MKIIVENLRREFGQTVAVNDVSFQFESGQIFGFVGPNGAGKTTSMRIMATLDEPTAGVDVELRRQLWELVGSLNAEGVTVVLTTHYLEEAEQLCDNIAIINHGELIANKPTRELVDMAREKIVEVTLDAPIDTAPQDAAFGKVELLDPRRVAITYDKDRITAGQVLNRLQEQGMRIEDVITREADLEDVFVSLTSAATTGGDQVKETAR